MNQDIKTKWVEALRSGKYKQGRDALCTAKNAENFYCCLGVLCDVVDPNGWNNAIDTGILAHKNQLSVPDYEIYQKANLRATNGTALVIMNDDYGESFIEIADYIEKNL